MTLTHLIFANKHKLSLIPCDACTQEPVNMTVIHIWSIMNFLPFAQNVKLRINRI